MATNQLNNFNFSFTVRRAPKTGPTSSDKWNDTVDELGKDLANIAQQWNLGLVPIMNGLPNGSLDSSVNAFINGLDGNNMWVDQTVTALSDIQTYFNPTSLRPYTVKEQFDDVYASIVSTANDLQSSINTATGALTTNQKIRIGSNVFNSSSVSTPTSLDGKSEASRVNLIQVANDLYGAGTLNNNGLPSLANSVKSMVDALLLLHNGSWPNDVVVSHDGIIATSIILVAPNSSRWRITVNNAGALSTAPA